MYLNLCSTFRFADPALLYPDYLWLSYTIRADLSSVSEAAKRACKIRVLWRITLCLAYAQKMLRVSALARFSAIIPLWLATRF